MMNLKVNHKYKIKNGFYTGKIMRIVNYNIHTNKYTCWIKVSWHGLSDKCMILTIEEIEELVKQERSDEK